MQANQREVKRILLNKSFQLKMIGAFGGLIVLASSAYAFAVYMFFDKFITLGNKIGVDPNHVFWKFMDRQQESMYTAFGITFIVTLILFLFIGFKFSHKVAGPLYRLNEHLKSIAENNGELKEIKFRDGDFFKEIEENFNEVVKSHKNNN